MSNDVRYCKFYRNTDTIHIGVGIGYCDLDCDQTTCEGDIDFCEKPDALKTYLFEQIRKQGGFHLENKRKNSSSINS